MRSAFVQRLMDDIELEPARPFGKCHVALQLLELIEAASTKESGFPAPFLDSFHRSEYRQALWHCYLMPNRTNFSYLDMRAIKVVVENINSVPLAISWGDVFAASAFLKVDDPSESWIGIWREYESERERNWWGKSGSEGSASLGCLWLGVVALCCSLASAGTSQNGGDQQRFSKTLWLKIWQTHFDGVNLPHDYERMIAIFLVNQIEKATDLAAVTPTSIHVFLSDVGLDEGVWRAILTRLSPRPIAYRWLVRHIKTSRLELLKNMTVWAESQKISISSMPRITNVFEELLNAP